MPSRSFSHWRNRRYKALDQIAAAHTAVGGVGPGRRFATQQINQAYAMLLSSQFQGFCRDLHSEAVDNICDGAGRVDARLLLLRIRLTTGRKLDLGNPNPGNLGSDFAFFDLSLWTALEAHNPANADRDLELDDLNKWRNAIAHQSFDPAKLDGRSTLLLKDDARRWRRTCDRLAADMDVVVRACCYNYRHTPMVGTRR